MGNLERERREIVESFTEQNTPLPGNKCKDCGGDVARSISSVEIFRNRTTYNTPACRQCGRQYPLAVDTPTYGEKEFLEKLNTPYY